MDREQWKERLLKAGIAEEVVTDLLDNLKDEDLLRMKDMTPEEIVNTLKEAAEELPTEDAAPAAGDASTEGTPSEDADDTAAMAAVLKEFGDGIVQRVMQQMKEVEITVEAPEMAEIVSQLKELKDGYVALQTTLKEMQSAWDEILKTDTERLRERLKDLSPANRVRLRATLGDEEALARVTQFLHEQNQAGVGTDVPPTDNIFRRPLAEPGTVRIIDSEGKEYASLGDLARGQPKG